MLNIGLNKVTLKNGEEIAYRERPGESDPVVLIHGNMTSSKHWDLVFEQMDEQYHLIAVDLRGFGASTYNQPIESLADFAIDVKEMMDIIGVEKAHFVGWSTGGGVVMKLAILYPELVASLILLNSLSTRGYPYFLMDDEGKPVKRAETKEEILQDKWKYIPISNAYKEKNAEFLKSVWNQLIYTKNQPDEKRYDEYVEDMCTQRNLAEIYDANNRFNISCHGGTGEVDKITAPVLIFGGERDLVVTKEMVEETREDFGDRAEFHLLTDCGHSPLIDDLPQLLQVMTNFIDKHREK